jgi:hypothetical protein
MRNPGLQPNLTFLVCHDQEAIISFLIAVATVIVRVATIMAIMFSMRVAAIIATTVSSMTAMATVLMRVAAITIATVSSVTAMATVVAMASIVSMSTATFSHATVVSMPVAMIFKAVAMLFVAMLRVLQLFAGRMRHRALQPCRKFIRWVEFAKNLKLERSMSDAEFLRHTNARFQNPGLFVDLCYHYMSCAKDL